MKRVFCIDYENVTFVGAKGIEALKSSDKVLIFVNNGAKGISPNAAKVYIATKAKIRFVDVEIGKPNALDFQLITYIAAKCNPSTEYYIISKDCGYDFAISMLVRCGKKNVHRFPTIAMALAGENVIGDTKTYSSEKTASAETKVNGVEKQQIPNDNNPFKEVFELIQSCGVAFDKDVYKNIIDAVEKTNGKFRCFTMLRSKYPSENNSCEVYQKIKKSYFSIKEAIANARKIAKQNSTQNEEILAVIKKFAPKLTSIQRRQTAEALLCTDNKLDFYEYLRDHFYKKRSVVPFYKNVKKHYEEICGEIK